MTLGQQQLLSTYADIVTHMPYTLVYIMTNEVQCCALTS